MTGPVTAADLTRWADGHYEYIGGCPACHTAWPCAVVRLVAAVQHRDQQIQRVRDHLAHARKISPSPSMCVYVDDVLAVLDGRPERVRGTVGSSG